MDITFILPLNALNGGNRVVSIYARILTDRGHRVNVISQPEDPIGIKDRLKNLLGYKSHQRKQPPRSNLLDFLGPLHRVLDTQRPPRPSDVPDADVIIATWWETAEWVAALPASKGRKHYLLQGYEVFPHLPVERVIATYSLPLKKIAVSHYIRDQIFGKHGIPDIGVVPNSVDTQHFKVPERQRNRDLTVGFLYSTALVKRTSLAIAALSRAKERIPSLKACSFGTHLPTEQIPLPSWVSYEVSPAQSRIPKIYAACDLWLFTSDNEGFGLPILEAMACRTPVLATRGGASPEIITGRNGMLLPAEAEAFAAEMLRFSEMSDAEWQTWSTAALQTATGYTWDDATDRLLAELSTPALVA